ncbi:unnamed protein product [Staurois parvus]|uniref:Immunoglobulin subtype domain-containing protein n=1 Tax=Staurois parvus TaxID=386267 RepID=A0ABN9HR45_9NEOB|nr:unnamed protein product [Staurois parvus]
MYTAFCIHCLVLAMTPICVNACGKISIDQNPRELDVGHDEMRFTCTVTSSCNFSSYVEKGSTILARIPPLELNHNTTINISGEPSNFIVTVRKTMEGTHLGVYYCGAVITVKGQHVRFVGSGTHIYSGCHFIGTKTGIVFAMVCACVGMINLL